MLLTFPPAKAIVDLNNFLDESPDTVFLLLFSILHGVLSFFLQFLLSLLNCHLSGTPGDNVQVGNTKKTQTRVVVLVIIVDLVFTIVQKLMK